MKSSSDHTCRHFTLAEIQSATRSFDDTLVIGQGGFGKVYKCHTNNGPLAHVAIKRLRSMSNQGPHEFWAEVEMLSKLRHCNLVSLIGYCNEGPEMVLVYEFMPNGTLEDHLHKARTGLSWLQRLKICIGAARGLDYLHTGTGTQHGVIHRDVKSSNILLDENFAAKISDFGLAKIGPTNQTRTHVSTGVKGTFGYMDPCYFFSGQLTRKSDVYAFGVVLFEVLCGRPAVDLTLDEEQWGLASWAQDRIKEGNLHRIVESGLTGQISKKGLKEFVCLAGQCLHNQPKRRPTMAEVVVSLESILSRHQRENIHLDANEGVFLKMVKSYLWAKPDLTPARVKGPDSGTRSETDKSIIDVIRKAVSSSKRLRVFTYAELAGATMDFKRVGYSPTKLVTVYNGWVDETTYAPTKRGTGLAIYVRVKKIGTSKLDLGLEEFNHPNLVKLLGYCLHEQDLFCVYEFIPNTSLDQHLFGGATWLSWDTRMKIALGAAKGLDFLHQRKQVAYIQFKTSAILLDKDLNTRLSEFEVENSFLVDDSYGFNNDAFYAAPEWFSYQVAKLDGFREMPNFNDGHFGLKSEIYSFGVVLLEMLTGMKVYDVHRPKGKQNLVNWATPLLTNEENLGVIMDPKLQHNHHPPKGAFDLALLVSKCLQPYEIDWPSMNQVIAILYACTLLANQ